MAVIAIMAALAAVSAGIYSGYVERAREAELYETAEQIKNALAICEAQYGEAGGSDASVFWSEAFLAPYVERAREAELYETAEQIKNALAICEAQYGEAGGSDASVFWSEAFLAPPNHRDSVLYPYVGTMTEDCTGYSLKIKRNGEGRYFIAGFTYSTEEYEPNHRDSVLYPYVGTMTEDCTGYSLKIKRNGEGRYFIAGFTYSTEEYEITWKKNDGITVKKRGKS